MLNDVQGSAEFSEETPPLYRWRLDRWWSDEPRALICMANPSIAGGDKNDPTVSTIIRLLRPLPGYGGFTVVNELPYIATDPKDLTRWRESEFPEVLRGVGRKNEELIRSLSLYAKVRIVAWGALVDMSPNARRVLNAMSLDRTEPLYCLGRTNNGAPKHPLARGKHRIPDGTTPMVWRKIGEY